jgi:hypothetical protein
MAMTRVSTGRSLLDGIVTSRPLSVHGGENARIVRRRAGSVGRTPNHGSPSPRYCWSLSRRSHRGKSLFGRVCPVGYRDGLLIRYELPRAVRLASSLTIIRMRQRFPARDRVPSSRHHSHLARRARLSVHRDKALTDFSETGIRAPSIRAPTGCPLDWGTMAFPTVLTIVRLGQWRPPAPRARGRFLLTAGRMHGTVGIDMEVKGRWAEMGRRLRTMACVSTTTSIRSAKGATGSPIG